MKYKEILSRPINHNEIEWRVQSQTKNKDKLIIVPYINNRCVMERFDEAFGNENWSPVFMEVDGGFICTITATVGDVVIRKSDGASRTNIEPVKGGISDSMKRAAVQFGLGRCLYNYPKIMIQATDKYIPDWAYPRLGNMVDLINKGEFKQELVILKKQ